MSTEHLIGRDEIISPEACSSRRVMSLYTYWQRMRGDRVMPKRSDIDPVDLWALLPYIHLSEWHSDPEGVLFRVVGTEIVASAGHEYRGRWLHDILPDPADLEQIMTIYHRAIATRVPIFGRTDRATVRLGVEIFEWVLCPLSEDGKTITHFIGLEDYISQRRYLGAVP